MNDDLNSDLMQGDHPGLHYRSRQIDESGRIHIKNISAYWMPKLTVTEVIAGTLYTVTGNYEGTDSFTRKLERITAKKFTNALEDSK